jgi:hypothetical protein
MLTRPTASPAARQAIQGHPKWALKDGDDISRMVRLLPLDQAVRLVDAYFPGWREDFLGVRAPGPWLTADEFFSPFMGDQLFSHEWNLVGRQDDLDAILRFMSDDTQKIAVVLGRGGIGKTRLLRAVAGAAEAASGREMRFLAVAGQPRPEDFEVLPNAQSLIIIDDAHERPDIAEILASISRARPEAKVLLSARPYGWDTLVHSLRRVGVHPSNFPKWELPDLGAQDAEALAREILAPDANEGVVRRLAQLTTDCPLITVLGAGLLKRGLLDPARLEGDVQVRADILHAFRDVLIADPATGDPELRRAVLDAVAILQPVRTDDPAFRDALEGLTDLPLDRLMPHIRSLENSGALLGRAQSFRIVPDMLGDVILAEACFDGRSGTSTGYVERTRKLAEGEALQNVFVNASRIDWQVRQDHPGAPSIADSLWTALEDEFQAAGIRGRMALLKLLGRASFYQPARALALTRWAVEHPTDASEETDLVLARLYAPTYADVLHELPTVVKYCAYTLEYLQDSVDLLWDLAQLDDRPTNQHPDHALRALTDLAGFETGKPIEFNEAVVTAAERWLANAQGGPHSPFDVLEAVLATEGSDQQTEGFTLSFRPYGLNVPVVRELRARVVAMAFKEARSADLRHAVRAIEAIGSSLHYPIGMFGRPVEPKEQDAWTPIFVEIIDQLRVLAGDTTLDPVLGVAIHTALNWHARHSTGETHQPALDALQAIPTSREHELALLLFDGWGHLLVDHIDDYQEAEQTREARNQNLATAMAAGLSVDEIIDFLCGRLDAQRQAFGPRKGSPGQFVWTLVGTSPAVGEAICSVVRRDPGSALRDVVPVVLSQIAQHRPDRAVALARELLATDSIEVVRSVAQAFGWNRGLRRSLLEGELYLLQGLAAHDDIWVRTAVIRAAELIAKEHRGEAIDLLCRVRFDDSPRVAQELTSAFSPQADLTWNDLSPRQAGEMLGQLLVCPSIEDFHITQFLGELSRTAPDSVLKFLRDRVEYAETINPDGYRALPYMWHADLHFRSHPKFEQMLRDVRDWIAANLDSWQRRWIGAQMFSAVAGKFDVPVIGVLDEALASGLRDQIDTVAAILREAPRDLVWENVPFVRRALHAAAEHGDDCVRTVGSGLHSAVTSGGRSGTPGQPFPEDVEQRDRASEIAETLPGGSIEDRFYRSLIESAEASMRWSLDNDAKLVDGREW